LRGAGGAQGGGVDARREAARVQHLERVRLERRVRLIHVLVHLDVDVSVRLSELDRLIDDLPWCPGLDERVERLDVLGIEPDAAVRRQATDGPRIVRAVDRVDVDRETNAVIAEDRKSTRLNSSHGRISYA